MLMDKINGSTSKPNHVTISTEMIIRKSAGHHIEGLPINPVRN